MEREKVFFRTVLLYFFDTKKTAAEAHRLLLDTYGEQAPSEPNCRYWFQRFKRGNFDVGDKQRAGRPKKFDNKELEALLDENPNQTNGQLAESLGVDLSTVCKRVKLMEKCEKQE